MANCLQEALVYPAIRDSETMLEFLKLPKSFFTTDSLR